ncbi:MAG TPA: J domain-containing protein [Anaeromyxobacteraceae bacterium]|nr:J domain-containing protein [Anaeromyxobacteraceae bacterium]
MPGDTKATGAGGGLAPPEVTEASAIAAGLPAQGTLQRRSALHLHYLAASAQASGRLRLEPPGGSWALVYRRGVIEHVSGDREEDDLASFLVRRGALQPEAAADARQLAPAFGGDVLGALVELRLLDPAARFQDLKEHGAALAWRALASDAGSWAWEPGVAPPPSGFPLGSRWGMLVEAVRRIDPAAVRTRLGVRGALSIQRAGGRVEVAELMLNPQEARAASRFDGVQSTDELCAAWPADADATRRIVLLLAETELVTFGAPRLAPASRPAASPTPPARPAPTSPAGGPAATPPARSTPAPTPAPAPAASPAPPSPGPAAASAPRPPPRPPPPRTPAPAKPAAPAGLTVEALQAVKARLDGADHFQVLGVPRDADGARIKTAYFQLARTYHPDAARDGETPEARALRADVFARVASAWSVLETEASRHAYLEELAAGGAAQVDIGRIYQAEQAFEKVAPLVASRAYGEALARVNEALALYGDEPEYHVWKAWLEYLVAPEAQRKVQRGLSEKAIESALQRSPLCAPGWLFLGRIAKLSGDPAAAERAWKRGLEQVNDPEVERELRFLRR